MSGAGDRNEAVWEKLLKIKTSGRDASSADLYRFPYEPTAYTVLERLANTGHIRRDNVLLDYGCGKGRVGLFMSYQTRCRSIGIEYDERIFEGAVRNLSTAVSAGRAAFELCSAEHYRVPEEVDRIFFFNPFSHEILHKVFARISESYYEHPRRIMLFFYYPSEEYMDFLMANDLLEFVEEIDCRDLFNGNEPRERIAVFSMGQGPDT